MESFHSILGVVPRGGLYSSPQTRSVVGYPKNCVKCFSAYVNLKRVYGGAKTCLDFLGFVAIVRVRVYYVDLFVFFVLRH